MPLQARRGRPRGSLRQLFGRLRAVGVEPHPFGDQADDRVLELFAGASAGTRFDDLVQRWMAQDDGKPTASATTSVLFQGLEDSGQAAVLGINKGKYRALSDGTPVADCAARDLLACQYGWYYQVVADVAAAGASVIRQFENCDLVWRWMFDRFVEDDPIPPPAELYRRLTEDRSTWLSRFNLMVLACAVHGTRIVPTLFTLGGGSSLNDGQFEKKSSDEAGVGALNDEVYAAAKRGSPYGPGLVIPSAWGWAPFYYDADEIGVPPDVGDGEPETVTADDLVTFQRFGLAIRPRPGSTDAYERECCRRKSLALVAFGQAIGEHLALLDDALSGLGLSITDIVPYLELGNEMSVHWLSEVPRADFEAGAKELGTFMALLAGPAWSRCSTLRFSVPGIASWGSADPEVWETRLDWVRHAITDGLAEAHDFWVEVRSRGLIADLDLLSELHRDVAYAVFDAAHPEVAAWRATAALAGFETWPPAVGDALPAIRDLVHHANLHWFHANDRLGSAAGSEEVPGGYADEARLLSDIASFKEKILTNSVDNTTLSLTWALHPGGFPGAQPTGFGDGEGEYSSMGDPLFQSGMVYRLLLLALAQGAEIASWHTHIAPIKNQADGTTWNRYTAMGLRHDLVDGAASNFRAARDAFRRPAWYAMRRLAMFLSRTTAIRSWSADDALYVVRLESSDGFVDPDVGLIATPGPPARFKYAIIAWLAQDAAAASGRVRLLDLAGSPTYARVSLAPRVDTTLATGADDGGYPTGEDVRWAWTRGAATWTDVADVMVGRAGMDLAVHRASVETCPVPVCILTDATVNGLEVHGAAALPGTWVRGRGREAAWGGSPGLWDGVKPGAAWLRDVGVGS